MFEKIISFKPREVLVYGKFESKLINLEKEGKISRTEAIKIYNNSTGETILFRFVRYLKYLILLIFHVK